MRSPPPTPVRKAATLRSEISGVTVPVSTNTAPPNHRQIGKRHSRFRIARGVAADRVAARVERPEPVLAVAADGGGPAGVEPVLDHQRRRVRRRARRARAVRPPR